MNLESGSSGSHGGRGSRVINLNQNLKQRALNLKLGNSGSRSYGDTSFAVWQARNRRDNNNSHTNQPRTLSHPYGSHGSNRREHSRNTSTNSNLNSTNSKSNSKLKSSLRNTSTNSNSNSTNSKSNSKLTSSSRNISTNSRSDSKLKSSSNQRVRIMTINWMTGHSEVPGARDDDDSTPITTTINIASEVYAKHLEFLPSTSKYYSSIFNNGSISNPMINLSLLLNTNQARTPLAYGC